VLILTGVASIALIWWRAVETNCSKYSPLNDYKSA
jgi:hypothetical protein